METGNALSFATPLTEFASGAAYQKIKRRLIDETGLNYYAERDEDLIRRLQKRMNQLEIQSLVDYQQLLDNTISGPNEFDQIVAEMTIGETYFFRHQEHFDALRTIIFPELMSLRKESRRLRIWCAGCADGPEAYSLSILVLRDLQPQLADWDVKILGTDINRRSIAKAREGLYEEWALRATPDELRRACFTQEQKRWRIDPKFKSIITFQHHNLAEEQIPRLEQSNSFDLIVCRNVMIYFAPELMEQVVERFYNVLPPEGWLLVGPAEPNMRSFRSFVPVNAPGVTMYKKTNPPPSVLELSPEWLRTESILKLSDAAPLFEPPLRVRSQPPATSRPVPAESDAVENTLGEVRGFADRGDWKAALDQCERLLQNDNSNWLVHFYYGLVLKQLGRDGDSETALRKSICLDRESVLPPYYLGLFLQSAGESLEASRHFEDALELLDARRDGEIVPDADGLTVAEMKKLAKMQLEVLRKC